MTETPATLAGALAQLQAKLPRVGKGKTAKVKTKTGSDYSYQYADLADVTAKILPKLSELGLCFIAKPTFADGRFGLAYSLLHISGQREDGYYPLPGSGTPQEIGSAITYARRYCLCAITGVAPDGDDDDAQAAEHGERQRRQEAVPRNRDGRISASRASDAQKDAAGLMNADQRKAHNELRRGVDGPLEPAEHAKLRRCSPGNPCREADCPDCTADADVWTIPPPTPPLRTPRPAQSLPSKIAIHLARLGVTDDDVRLGITAQLAGTGRLSSSKELTAPQARKVLGVLEKCRDAEALREALDEVSVDA